MDLLTMYSVIKMALICKQDVQRKVYECQYNERYSLGRQIKVCYTANIT